MKDTSKNVVSLLFTTQGHNSIANRKPPHPTLIMAKNNTNQDVYQNKEKS